MKIIKHGKFYNKIKNGKMPGEIKCLACKCVFRYANRDRVNVYDPRERDGIEWAVACPECDDLTYLNAENVA